MKTQPVRRSSFFLTLLLLFIIPITQAENVKVRAEASIQMPAGTTIVPKQALKLNVDVWTSTWFAKPVRYPEWQIPGGVILDTHEKAVPLMRRFDGENYAGISKPLLLIPQQTGMLALPESTITLYPKGGEQGLKVNVSTPPLEVKLPKGADLDRFLPASRLVLTQTSSPDLNPHTPLQLETGDSFTRTLSIEADGIMGTFIPSIYAITPEESAPQGLEVYSTRPDVSNTVDEWGSFTGGKRTETVTYMARETGSYTLPAVSVRWWNSETGNFETESLPAIKFSVKKAAVTGKEAQLQQTLFSKLLESLGGIMILVVAGIVVLSIFARFRHALRQIFITAFTRTRLFFRKLIHSEPVYFYRLMLALTLNQRRKAAGLYYLWINTFKPRPSLYAVSSAAVNKWLSNIYSNHKTRIGSGTVRSELSSIRKVLLEKQDIRLSRFALPSLN